MEQSGARASKQLGAITAIAAGIEGGQQEQVLSWSKVSLRGEGAQAGFLGEVQLLRNFAADWAMAGEESPREGDFDAG